MAYVLGLLGLFIVGPLTVTALKGKWLLFFAGWLTLGVVWWIAAFSLAQPGSWWARRFYGAEKMQRARNRFG